MKIYINKVERERKSWKNEGNMNYVNNNKKHTKETCKVVKRYNYGMDIDHAFLIHCSSIVIDM